MFSDTYYATELRIAALAGRTRYEGQHGTFPSAYVLNMLGAGVGMWIFTKLANGTGGGRRSPSDSRRALVITLLVYWKMNSPQDAYWMMPLMGAAQLSVVRRFCDLLAGAFSQPAAQHRHVVLLQPGTICRRGRQPLLGQIGTGFIRPLRLAADGALLGDDDVRNLCGRHADVAVRTGNERQAAARVNELRAILQNNLATEDTEFTESYQVGPGPLVTLRERLCPLWQFIKVNCSRSEDRSACLGLHCIAWRLSAAACGLNAARASNGPP